MAAGDDGGFTPHPGDPWHPGWTPDGTEDDPRPPSDEDAVEPEAEEESSGRRKRKGRRRKSKRRRRKESEAVEPDPIQAAAFDPTTTAFDAPDVVPGTEPEDADAPDDDPFEAVLERERDRGSRRGGDDKAPPPAWTVDPEPTDEQSLPMEQPSWAGTATGGGEPVTAEGFEESDAIAAGGSPTEERDLLAGAPDQSAGVARPGEADGLPTESPAEDAVGDGETEIAGEFGVAGPEAYEVLGDIAGDGMDDWDAFAQGEAVAPGDDRRASDAGGDAEDPEPSRRRWFGRGRDDEVGEPTGEPAVESADSGAPDGVAASPDALTEPDPGFSAPTEALADGDAFDDWVASAEDEPPRTGWFGRRKRRRQDDIAAEPVESAAWPELASPEDPAPSRPDEPVAAEPDALVSDLIDEPDEVAVDPSAAPPQLDESPSLEEPVLDAPAVDDFIDSLDEAQPGTSGGEPTVAPGDEGLPADGVTVDPSFDLDAAVGAALEELGPAPGATAQPEASDTATQPELFDEQPPPDATAARQPADPDAVDAPDWEGDPSRVPASWFADVDEDEVVPPPVADTPETEWPGPEASGADAAAAAGAEASRDRDDDPASPKDPEVAEVGDDAPLGATVEPAPMVDPDTEVFDHEAPLDTSPPPAADVGPPLPEGYEPWGEAVEGALEAAEGPDDATYEYEPLLEQQPAAAEELPAGFERFPGDMEQFQLSEEELAAELGTGERGWVTRAVDSGDQGDAEFDEQIYAGPGTVVHQDLAAAIAAEGEDLTQWQALSAAMPGLETGVLGFEDVADLADEGDYVAPTTRSNLGARVATGFVLLGLLFGTLLLSDVAFAAFIGLLLMLGLVEFYTALRRSGYLPLTLFGLVGGAGTLLATWFHGPIALPVGVFLTSTLTFFFYAFSPTRRDALANGGLTVLGMGWVIATVGFVIPIARAEDPVPLIVAVVAATAAMDVGAYSFGRTWGRRPLSPSLSPNKTTEGLVGGALLAVAVAAAFGFIGIGPFEVGSALLLGLVIVVLAPLGDLAESMVKRSLGIKDMGATLPGHGGVLDRIDAFLFVVPGAWAFFELAGFLG